jgi:hypothetical protein
MPAARPAITAIESYATCGHEPFDGKERAKNHQRAGAEGPHVESSLGITALFGADKKEADDRSDDADNRDRQRQVDGIHSGPGLRSLETGEPCGTENHRRDNCTDIGLEEVGAHAGHVAHVVANVVGDGGGVQRVVFGNTSFDLTDEVGTDICGLGVNSAADAREERN